MFPYQNFPSLFATSRRASERHQMMGRTMKCVFCAATLAVLTLGACVENTSSGGEETRVYVAYLDTCLESVEANVARLQDSYGYEAMRIPLDSRVLSHSEIAGVVQVSSREIPREDLLEYANGIVSECRSLYQARYSTEDPDGMQRMADFLNEAAYGRINFEKADGTMGLVNETSVYLSFDSGFVTVYFDVE